MPSVEKTFCTGTPIRSARSRSMSAKRRGVPVLNGVKAPATLGLLARPHHHAPRPPGPAPCSPCPPRSSIIILKPPPVPMPWTGGGAMTSTLPPVIAPSAADAARLHIWSARTCARRAASARRRSTPALGALVKVAPSRPANPTAVCTRRVAACAIVDRLRTTASVRCSEAPGGSWTTPIR